MKRTSQVAIAAAACLVAYMLFWPVPIDPIAWEAPEAPPLEGQWAPNGYLEGVERLEVSGVGPEDVAVDGQGRIYAGLQDGRIIRMPGDGSSSEVFAETGGRPLGLDFDASGNLIVADAFEGLLEISPSGNITVLTTEADEIPFGLTDDIDVAESGLTYFSDASSRHDQHGYIHDIAESRPNGRLLAYDPATDETYTLIPQLHFANGVAVSPNGLFVLVIETTRYRVLRHWIAGPRRGQTDTFIDNLPGFPDGISAGPNGIFWVPLISPRNGLLDGLSARPFLRKMLVRLPEAIRPKAARYPFVVGLDSTGRVVHNLQASPDGPLAYITSVEQVGSMLYLGSLEETALGRIAVPE